MGPHTNHAIEAKDLALRNREAFRSLCLLIREILELQAMGEAPAVVLSMANQRMAEIRRGLR